MDASALVVLLVLCFGSCFTMQLSQDLQTSTVTTNSNDQNMSNVDNSTVVKCVTARGIAGSCVDRKYCNYGTYAVDLTLYAPKDYKKTCPEKEACCPFSSQIQVTVDPKPTWEDNDLIFD